MPAERGRPAGLERHVSAPPDHYQVNSKSRKDGASGEAGIMRNTWTVAVKSVGAAIFLRPIPAETGKPSGNGGDISIKVEELVKPTGLRNAHRQIAGAVVFVEGWATVNNAAILTLS